MENKELSLTKVQCEKNNLFNSIDCTLDVIEKCISKLENTERIKLLNIIPSEKVCDSFQNPTILLELNVDYNKQFEERLFKIENDISEIKTKLNDTNDIYIIMKEIKENLQLIKEQNDKKSKSWW